MSNLLFITGTDTGVGKTVITAALGAYLREEGLRVMACKPFESGEPLHGDSRFLKEMIPLDQSIDEINCYAFREALAPGIAAERAGVHIDIDRVTAHIRTLQNQCDVLLVEGAGGLFVPIAPKDNGHVMVIDFIEQFHAPILLMGRLGLGTINHSLLSISECRNRCMYVLGLVINQTEPHGGPAEETNLDILRRNTDIALFGPFAYLSTLDRSALLAEAKRVLPERMFFYDGSKD